MAVVSRRYYERTREDFLKKSRDYYDKNKQMCQNRIKRYGKKRYQIDQGFRILKNIRTRVKQALRIGSKTGSAIRDLGCTGEELKRWLELFFPEGMTWDNYGIEWHIDHVKPLSSFDLTNREQFLEACNYRNLQPLWAADNLAKGDSETWWKVQP